jgi:hypothetical protein
MTIKQTKNTMTQSLQRIQKELAAVPGELHEFWVKTTPRHTGNARRRTVLRGNTITASYPYAAALDSGTSSQAPDGMSKPTEQYLETLLDKKIRK